MSNTDKLLRAFIEASGYEVEEIHIPLDDHAISDWNNKWRNANTSSIPPKPEATIDYKVTRREVDMESFFSELLKQQVTNEKTT